jgi:hypothetical protein
MEDYISLPFDEERKQIRAKYALYYLVICVITLTVYFQAFSMLHL